MALSTDAVVDVALGVVDESGPDALTLSAVATRAGVATPSLYKHVRNLAELRELVSSRILSELSEHVAAAVLGHSADEAIRALMLSWRDYVVRHPHRYSAVIQAPTTGTLMSGTRLIDLLLAALRAYGLEESAAVHAARCLRACVHGFVALEAEGAFGLPQKLDDSYDLLISIMITGLTHQAEVT